MINSKMQELFKVREKIVELKEEMKKTTDEKRKEEIRQLIEKCDNTIVAISTTRLKTKVDKRKTPLVNLDNYKRR